MFKNNNKTLFNQRRDKGLTGKFLFHLYRFERPKLIRKFVIKLHWYLLGANFHFYSETIRKIFKYYHDVEIGLYSGGFCFEPGVMPPGTKIGRYCSFANGLAVVANHPITTISTSALFYNTNLGYAEDNNIIIKPKLKIGHDVWIGRNAIILTSCSIIEDGAVIGAGVIVNKNIPEYSVAIGHPCRIIKKRFSDEIINQIKESRWWEKSIEELKPDMKKFLEFLEE